MNHIKSIVFVIAGLFSLYPAQAADFSLSLESYTGIISGLAQEYVFEGDKQISRLEWEEKHTPYTNAALKFNWNRFFITGALSAAIPVQSGSMRNHDYLLPYTNELILTNYSEHDVFLERHNSYNIGIGYELNIRNWYTGVTVGFLYFNRKWTASDGYYQYAPYGQPLTDEPKRKMVGAVITYDQKISYFHLDLAAGYRFFNTLYAGLTFDVYPYIWIENKDHHILRSFEFYDIIPGSIGGSVGLLLAYRPSRLQNWELFAGFTFEKLFLTKGTTAQRTTGVNEESAFKRTSGYNSGFDSEYWRFFMGVKYTALFK